MKTVTNRRMNKERSLFVNLTNCHLLDVIFNKSHEHNFKSNAKASHINKFIYLNMIISILLYCLYSCNFATVSSMFIQHSCCKVQNFHVKKEVNLKKKKDTHE